MELCSENLKTYIKKLHGSFTINDLTDEHMFKWVLTFNVYHRESKNPLKEECLRIFLQILKGVQHIHLKNLIHRDLKTQNILLDEGASKVKIGDFGFATIQEASENSFVEINHSIGIGTPGYIAPEQLQGSNYNSKADMYSLGIILLQLFCPGQTDFEFSKYVEDLKKFNKLPFTLEASLPDVAEIIRQLTQRDPKKRPTVSELLKTSLFLDRLIEQKRLKLKQLETKKLQQKLQKLLSFYRNYLIERKSLEWNRMDSMTLDLGLESKFFVWGLTGLNELNPLPLLLPHEPCDQEYQKREQLLP
jgi:translation initiation factor 2-alpha kinase 1